MIAVVEHPHSYGVDGPARNWLVMGAPMEGSGTGRGERHAPRALREAGLVEAIGATDFGDLAVSIDDPERHADTGITGYADLVTSSAVLRDGVASSLSAGWHPLVLGGCCSIVPGVLAGVRNHLGPVGLAFVDGHSDTFDARTSSTGEAAGMDLAIVCGHGDRALTGLASGRPIVDPGDVVAVGDADADRRRMLGAPGPAEVIPDAHVISAEEVRRRGSARCGEDVAQLVGDGTAPFWLHLDLDVVDAAAMPASSFPVDSGLGWEDVEALVAPVAASSRLIGMSLTDLNVDLDLDGAACARVVELMTSLLAAADDAHPAT